MDILEFLIWIQLKDKFPQENTITSRDKQSHGFTLIELLAAIVLAVLVITPLLGVAVHLLNTDRQEQAKASSEQELQLAADYITRDLQQAIFIYDEQGLNNDNDSDPSDSGIKDQIPPEADAAGCTDDNCIPVLAFWKRRLFSQAIPHNSNDGTNCESNDEDCNDAFVYALVVYYLILDDDSGTWSNTARIGRFEISDGLRDLNNEYLDDNESKKTIDEGFKLFELNAGEAVENAMNTWENDGSYEKSVEVLVDYIDNTTDDDTDDTIPREACPETDEWSQVPSNTDHPFSFYACINSEQNIARVFLRGNARARFQDEPDKFKYTESQSSYFPTVRTEVKALGKLVQ